MISQHLRQYSALELAARRWVMVWRQQGFDVRQGLSSGHHLLHFTTDAGWEGVVDLACWFSQRVPHSAGLSRAAWNPEQLATLFVSCDRPLTGLPDALNYQRVERKGALPSTFAVGDFYACHTPQGRVWIRAFPSQAAHAGANPEFDASHLPLPLQFQLGSSLISLSLLGQLQAGDVVLVNRQKNVVASQGDALGQFITTEEGFMFSEDRDELCDDLEMATGQQAWENEAATQPLVSRSNIKLKLDVVLQQSTVSVAELEALYRGHIMPCHPEAQRNVVLAVNGVSIAKGELIWVEERLGVEITDIYQEVGNVTG